MVRWGRCAPRNPGHEGREDDLRDTDGRRGPSWVLGGLAVLSALMVAVLAAYLLTQPVRDALGIPVSRSWAVGSNPSGGVVIDTHDGWATWNAPFAALGQNLFGLTFASPEEGFAVGMSGSHQPLIFGSRDGGHTWVRQRVPGGSYGLYGVSFPDARHGFAVGFGPGGGVVLRTSDSGRTWSLADSIAGVELLGIDFPSSRTGWIVGRSLAGGQSVVLGTSDGGRTWRQAYRGGQYTLVQVRFDGPSVGWAVGYGYGYAGVVVGTRDGGRTWRTLLTTTQQGLFSLSAVGSSDVWVAGMESRSRGFIAHSEDGGRTWRTAYEGGTHGLLGISMRTTADGYAIGSDSSQTSVVLVTADGGRTWNEHAVSVQGNVFWGIY